MSKRSISDETMQSRRLVVSMTVFLLAVWAGSPPGFADGVAPQKSSPADSSEFGDPEKSEETRQIITIAIYLFLLLTAAAVGSLILLLLWGSRMRRQARQPLPETTPNDPLWYLKAAKSRSREPEDQSGASEGTSETPETDKPAEDDSS